MKTKLSMQHLDHEQLLRYADGELPARKARQIRTHIEACWQCRTEYEELQSLVSDCVRYRKNVLHPFLPSPPAPWGDIYQGFARIDAAGNDVPLFVRLIRAIQLPFRRTTRWIPAAVTLAVIGVLFFELRQTPSVQAAELLRKAVAAADSQPRKGRRIQIRSSQYRLPRHVGVAQLTPTTTSEAEAAASLETLFK